MKTILFCAALLAAAPAGAQGLGRSSGGYSVEYTGYSHGFTVLKLAGTLQLRPGGYSAHVTFHTAGMVAMVVHSDNDSQVTGVFKGDHAMPILFEGSGHFHGTDRVTKITYVDGNPVIRTLSPPVERERTAVPPEQTLHTIDTLSAVALLIHAVAESGRCDGSVTTFDGRRLATQAVHAAGEDMLPKTGRSIFAGQALRCDFDGQQLGGFVTNENQGDLRKPRHGSAWLAAILPNSPPVPVRVAFNNNILGEVTLFLTSVAPVSDQVSGQ